MPPVLALGAIGFGGFLLFKAVQQIQEDKAKERAFRAANGWSLEEVAASLTSGFDQDGDGRLAFDVVKGARLLGESSTTVLERRWSESLNVFGIPTGAKAVRETHVTYTLEPTLRKADADGDGVATQAELAALLRTFDADVNGRLSAVERGQALTALGKVFVSRETKTVGVVPPAPSPVSPSKP